MSEQREFLGIMIGFKDIITEDVRTELLTGITLSENLIMRTLNENDLERMKFSYEKYGNYKEIVIETIGEPDFLNDDFNSLKKVLLSFRLHKVGDVYLKDVYSLPKDNSKMKIKKYESYMPQIFRAYELILEEMNEFNLIFSKISSLDFHKENRFRVAFDRFDRYYKNYRFDDKIIDLMIAFEALFLRGLKDKNKGQKIAERCSILLSPNDDRKRKETAKILQESYRLRNAIVHGESPANEKLPKYLPKLEDFFRKAVKKMIL